MFTISIWDHRVKGIVHQKKKTFLNLYDFLASANHKRRYFEENKKQKNLTFLRRKKEQMRAKDDRIFSSHMILSIAILEVSFPHLKTDAPLLISNYMR